MAATLCENVNGQLKPVGGQFIEPFSYSYTPIGSIVPILGTTVPDGYLVCDGTSYNITDYQELAAYFVDQFGSVNYFGGNGITTFAIPNITGAPADVLSCIAVKNLYFANTGVTPSDSFVLRSQILTFNNENVAIINAPNVTSDTFFFVFYHDSSRSAAQGAGITVRSGSGELIFTAENAPTSFLVCDVMCTNFEHQSGETIENNLPILFDELSEEHAVGWYRYANGTKKPVYLKSFKNVAFVMIEGSTTTARAMLFDSTAAASVDVCLGGNFSAYSSQYDNTYYGPLTLLTGLTDISQREVNQTWHLNRSSAGIFIGTTRNDGAVVTGRTCNATIYYTKTTDTPV